jgi:hypothetical protein
MKLGLALALAIVIAIWSAGIPPAEAEIDVKTYREMVRKGGESKEWLKLDISGVGRGFVIANYQTELVTGKRLFCTPKNFILQGDNFHRFLEEDVKNLALSDGFKSIELVLLFGLQQRFPC